MARSAKRNLKGGGRSAGESLPFACSGPRASTADASTSYERSEKIAKEEQLGKKGAGCRPWWLTSPEKAETQERGSRGPLGSVSDGSKRLTCFLDQTQNRQGGVGQRGKDLSQARPFEVVTILVPPTVFGKVKAVFDLPVVANVALQPARRDPIRVKAGGEIATLARAHRATGRTHFAIDTENNLAMREVQTLADVVGNFQVEP